MNKALSTLALIGITAGFLSADEAPVKHIRVIVDTSKSLHRNDPNGYVKTATAMFYDLSWQILKVKDTFVIVPFDPTWPEVEQPPESVGKPMTPGRSAGERMQFNHEMLDTPYESQQTYFSPGMYYSFNDLEKQGPNDQKIIVLVTDGLPDKQTIRFDAEKLKALVPRMAKSKIKVYILAFGAEVNQEWFNDVFHFNAADGVAGQLFVGKDASKLLDNMLDIFSRSFGYSRSNFENQSKIDLTGGVSRDQAVVVALYKPGQEPGFQLATPDGRPVVGDLYKVPGKADPLAKPKPGIPVSYAFQWLHQPAHGNYGFKSTGGAPEQVAVLYPGGLDIKLRQYGSNPLEVVMAGKAAPMEVIVSPASGTGDDPGSITIRYHLHYLKKDDTGAAAEATEYPPSAPVEGRYEKGVGRVFVIQPEFVRDPPGTQQGTRYQGYIDIKVTPLGSNNVLAEKGENMYPVQVYPYVSLHPTPPEITLLDGAREKLRGGDNVCSEFRFQLQGNSNNLKERDYTLGARFDPPLQFSGEWRGARFRFDDREMEAASTGRWQATTRFDPSQIDSRRHKLCVQVGSPSSGMANHLKVEFGVWPSTDIIYQRLNVVDPLAANIGIEAPDFWQIWKPWLLLLVTLLLLYLTYLFWRSRSALPPDLAVSLADGEGALTRSKLGEGSLAARWLGLAQARPLISVTGDRELGSVRPVAGELFLFLPAKGFGLVMAEENGEWQRQEIRGDGSMLLQAGRRYRAGSGKDARFFRLDYSESRPEV